MYTLTVNGKEVYRHKNYSVVWRESGKYSQLPETRKNPNWSVIIKEIKQ